SRARMGEGAGQKHVQPRPIARTLTCTPLRAQTDLPPRHNVPDGAQPDLVAGEFGFGMTDTPMGLADTQIAIIGAARTLDQGRGDGRAERRLIPAGCPGLLAAVHIASAAAAALDILDQLTADLTARARVPTAARHLITVRAPQPGRDSPCPP